MRRAYAVGVLDTSQEKMPFPIVVGVGVFSESAGEVTLSSSTRFPFDIAEESGKDYEEARKNVIARLREDRYLRWAYALLSLCDLS